MKKRAWILILLSLLLVGIIPAAAQDDDPFYEPIDCPFPELNRVECGILYVPEDRDDPDGNEIELMVAIISARNGNPAPDPVIYLEGGPGGAAIIAVEDFMQHPLSENRDLILLDQRGNGFSYPNLNCYEIEEQEEDGDPTEACYERLLDEGINLSAYTSAESAADVEDLRLALGYDEINLYGISYGTRLALTIMRDYPDSIRSVVIDSVFPPEVNAVTGGVADTIRALDYLFAQCAADPDCSDAYPTVEDDFYDMIDAFNLNPPVFLYDDGEEESDFELYGDDVLEAMFQTLYVTEAIPMLPYGITLLANAEDDFDYSDGFDIISGFWTPEAWINGETDFIESIVLESDEVNELIEELGDFTDSEGMYNSVTCAEEFPFETIDEGYDVAATAPEPIQEWLLQGLETAGFDCEIWQVEPSDDIEAERVISDIPTLVISGGFDPVTPPAYGDSALEGLSNGQHIVFANAGHGISGSPGCAADITSAFIDDPSADLDIACVAAEAQVEFYIED